MAGFLNAVSASFVLLLISYVSDLLLWREEE